MWSGAKPDVSVKEGHAEEEDYCNTGEEDYCKREKLSNG
jgi:hypothetical protein